MISGIKLYLQNQIHTESISTWPFKYFTYEKKIKINVQLRMVWLKSNFIEYFELLSLLFWSFLFVEHHMMVKFDLTYYEEIYVWLP